MEKKRAFWKKNLFWEIYFIGMCMTDFMEPCIKKMFLVFFPFPLEIYKFKILSAKCFCSFVKVQDM